MSPASSNSVTSSEKLDISTVNPQYRLSLTVWEEELKDDFDREFILNVIKNGFDIIEMPSQFRLNVKTINLLSQVALFMTEQLNRF